MDGKKARAIRQRLNLTQHQLAGRVGVTRNTVTRWECGLARVKQNAAIMLKRLARASL
ncbi:MAG: helix-turn-helix transcriptional regulator [Candidatus Binataceae bacterium]|jgi:transcriptional regulator with XRE-family HTH domain